MNKKTMLTMIGFVTFCTPLVMSMQEEQEGTPPASSPRDAPTQPSRREQTGDSTYNAYGISPQDTESPPSTLRSSDDGMINVPVPRSLVSSLLGYVGRSASNAFSATTHAAGKRWDPKGYVLDPANTDLYAAVTQMLDQSNDITALQQLLVHPQMGDVFKKIFDREAFGVHAEYAAVHAIVTKGDLHDGMALHGLTQIIEATEKALIVRTAITQKILTLMQQAAQETASKAAAGAHKLPVRGSSERDPYSD